MNTVNRQRSQRQKLLHNRRSRDGLKTPAVVETYHYRYVFQQLPEPNTACLVGVYAVTLDPLLSLYGIIYVTWYTRHLPKPTGVRFR